MPHYYAASGATIQLDESADDIGVRFGREDGAAVAKKAFRALAGPAKGEVATCRCTSGEAFRTLHDAAR